MNEKRTILHIIDYMGRGGAEVMLVKVLKELKEYHNIVVTLNPQNHFGDEFTCDEYHCLNMGSFARFPLAVLRLRHRLARHVDSVDQLAVQLHGQVAAHLLHAQGQQFAGRQGGRPDPDDQRRRASVLLDGG